jgi:hypothetical protein
MAAPGRRRWRAVTAASLAAGNCVCSDALLAALSQVQREVLNSGAHRHVSGQIFPLEIIRKKLKLMDNPRGKIAGNAFWRQRWRHRTNFV